MIRWIGVAFFVVAWMMFDGSAAINRAVAAPLHPVVQMLVTDTLTEVGTGRRKQHTRSADRLQDQFYYIDRPRYYTPAPFVPFNYGYVFWPRIFRWP
jgi:hypothetical protein